MKRVLLTVILLGSLLSLGACMFMGEEDKEFYGKGWVNPKELDKTPAPHMPLRPAADDPANASTLPAERSTQSSRDWSTPVPFEEPR